MIALPVVLAEVVLGDKVSWSWVSGAGITAGEHPSLHPSNLRIVQFQFWKKKKSVFGDFYLFICIRPSSAEVLTAPHFCIFSRIGGEAQPKTIHLLKKTEKVDYNISLCWPRLRTVPVDFLILAYMSLSFYPV